MSRLIVEEIRSSIVENYHPVMYVILNEKKEIISSSRDENVPVYYRSASKPLQALPAFLAGVPEKYMLTEEEAALFCASHRGEKTHINYLESLFTKLGITEEELACHTSYPLNASPKEELLWQRQEKRRLYHNCSGKHAGMIAAARLNGWDMSGYEKEDHPLQNQIREIISELSECKKEEVVTGIDGCGVPTFALPLYNLAISYLKFVCPEQIENGALREAVKEAGRVMNHAPEMIASDKFICTELLRDSNIIAKGGAQGVYTLALRDEKISIALKVTTGVEGVWPTVISYLLNKISYKNTKTIDRLNEVFPPYRYNDAGVKAGHFSVKEEIPTQ